MVRFLPTDACRPLRTHVAYNAVLSNSIVYFDDDEVSHLHLIKSGFAIVEHAGGTVRIDCDGVVYFPAGRPHRIVIPRGTSTRLVSASIRLQDTFQRVAMQALTACLSIPLARVEEDLPEVGMLFSEHAIAHRQQASIVEQVFVNHVAPRIDTAHRLLAPAVTSPFAPPAKRDSAFERFGQELLHSLRSRIPFDLWMITRTQNNDWTVLQSEDHGYGVKPGKVFQWSDSFCSEMVNGNGPCIAPNATVVPAYAMAPIGRQVPIGAYIGFPIRHADGRLFGTLCAIHPSPAAAQLNAEERFLQLQVQALSEVLELDLSASEDDRRKEREQAQACTDAALQVYNLDAWEHLSATEEDRCRRFGHQAAVLMIDPVKPAQSHPAKAGTARRQLLSKAAQSLRKVSGSKDIVARIGESELGILAVECDRFQAKVLQTRIESVLEEDGVDALVAMSLRDPMNGIHGAWLDAKKCIEASANSRHMQ